MLREAGERNKSPVSGLPKTIVIIIGSILAAAVHTFAEEPPAPHAIELSPGLHNLLKAEMQELKSAVQTIPVALASGDWKTIQDTSSQMQASYMMEKNLTPAETKELALALPARFKQLDAEFHQRAARLGAAALAREPELVAFRYSRLLESCALCHADYARSRFPGFWLPADHH